MPLPDSPRQRRDLLIEALCLVRDIDDLEDALGEFRERHLPAFETWFAERFTTERDAIRSLERDLSALVDRHNAILALAKMHDLSMERAQRMILKEERAWEGANAATRLDIEVKRRERREYLAREMEREFQSRAGIYAKEPASGSVLEFDVDRLKSIYRKLARRLHPDLDTPPGDETSSRWRRRYWSLLQTARENGDALALTDLELATRVRQLELNEFDVTEAERVRSWFRHDFDFRKAEFERARASAAWDFASAPEADVERRVRRELEQDAESLREELRDLKDEHEYLTLLGRGPKPTPHPKPRAPRPRSATTQQLSFFD